MAKSKEGRDDEFYKSQIRNFKKELKRKDQEIRQLEKQLGYNQNKSPKSEKATKNVDLNECQECGKGILQVSDLGIRKIIRCPVCTYRKVMKC